MRIHIISLMLLFSGIQFAYAQNPELSSGVTFKKLFLDYQSQNGGGLFNFKDYRHGYEVGYQHNFKNKFSLNIPVKYGNINAIEDSTETGYVKFVGADIIGQYHFYKPERKILPYVMAGVGGVQELGGDFNVQIPLGAGLNFRIAPNAYFNYQIEYRLSLAENRNNLHHGFGFVYLFKKRMKEEKPVEEEMKVMDSDGDGVEDELDLCPNEKGIVSLKGCPDKDGDGVPDYQDKCPDNAGPQIYNGCPDSDGDGVPDHEDECPNMAGSKANRGCPFKDKDGDGIADSEDACPDKPGTKENKGCPLTDRDGDGIPDDKDKCPDKAGLADNDGCPESDKDGDGIPDSIDKCPDAAGLRVYAGCPDTDNDGIPDHEDECPKIPGSVANNGCPVIEKEDKKTLDVAMQAVQFETGSAVLKAQSGTVLKQIANIMSRYPDFNMVISGHTDNVGRPAFNQTLSERRAKACFDYLIKEGVPAYRLNYAGYGDSRPISTNATDKGKSLNRRVEFNLVPRN
ncbi:MAG: OmpA family protein [Saprospiraceae bacterium]|nr:OmpA family protein [Saprospiraceae bacterium]